MSDEEHFKHLRRSPKTNRLTYCPPEGGRWPLHSREGTPEFRREYDTLVARLAQVEHAIATTVGTLGEAIDRYGASAAYLSSAPSTIEDYGRRMSEIKTDIGDVRLAEINAPFVAGLTATWLKRGHRVASLHTQVLRNVCKAAVLAGTVPPDAFAQPTHVKRPYGAGEPNPAWRDAEVHAVIAEALARELPGLARATGLARWGGFRRGSVCEVPVNARISIGAGPDAERRIYWLTKKRQVLADKPEDRRLTALLESTPDLAETIAYNAQGRPFNVRGLNQALDRLIAKLAAEGKVRPNLTLHGLRHARGVELANAGASDAEIMSQLEHRTTRAAQIYRRQAERRVLANSAQAKVDHALSAASSTSLNADEAPTEGGDQ